MIKLNCFIRINLSFQFKNYFRFTNLVDENFDKILKEKVSKRTIFTTHDNQISEIGLQNKQVQTKNKEQDQLQPEIPQFLLKQERLSKYLSRSGVTSRRDSERMIQQGIVFVNNKKVLSNMMVSEQDKIKIFAKDGEIIPVKQDTKLYMFHKPEGLICTRDDPMNRVSIFDYLRNKTNLNEKYIISVGRLDFNSEGLMLLTNNGELANCLESPHNNFAREYRVRVFGTIDEAKFLKLNTEHVIKGVKYGPFQVKIDSRQSKNTWILLKTQTGKNREIRKVCQKNDLQVGRLKRLAFGPFKLGKLAKGEVAELPLIPQLKRKFYLHLRKKLENFNEIQRHNLLEKYEITEEDIKTYNLLKYSENIYQFEKIKYNLLE